MQNKKGDENMSNKEKLAERWEQGRISEAMLRVCPQGHPLQGGA